MTNQHPITPPPELVEEWIAQVWHEGTPVQVSASDLHLASKAAEWGARYGHQPAPAAEGEVRGLVAELRSTASGLESQSYPQTAALITRAAELLEQRHPTPVPVAERLPGAVNTHFEFIISDADYCQQAGGIAPTYAQALSEGQRYLAQYQQDGPHTLELRRVEVLHPGALPVPQGEVE